MEDVQSLRGDYPWIQTPLVVGAPMRLIALADMAVEVPKAGKQNHMPCNMKAMNKAV
jgi:nitronate monooxygenase